jgi:hypothetical protein
LILKSIINRGRINAKSVREQETEWLVTNDVPSWVSGARLESRNDLFKPIQYICGLAW